MAKRGTESFVSWKIVSKSSDFHISHSFLNYVPGIKSNRIELNNNNNTNTSIFWSHLLAHPTFFIILIANFNFHIPPIYIYITVVRRSKN